MTAAEVAAQIRAYEVAAAENGGSLIISVERLDLWAAALEEEGK